MDIDWMDAYLFPLRPVTFQPVLTSINTRNHRVSRVSPVPPRHGRGDMLVSNFINLITLAVRARARSSKLEIYFFLRLNYYYRPSCVYTMHTES